MGDTMTKPAGVLELEVVEQRPCAPNRGACMSVETSAASAVTLESQHICGDGRAVAARAVALRMGTDARAAGFSGVITIHFPPGTYGAQVIDASGRMVPEVFVRPPRPVR